MSQTIRRYTYKRAEHLKQQKLIDLVFQQNKSMRVGPLKMVYAIVPADSFNYQVAFVAPKKIHHLAVDRNRNKRLMREAFRLNRHIITDSVDLPPVQVLFIFIAQNTDEMTFASASDYISRLLTQLSEKVVKNCVNL